MNKDARGVATQRVVGEDGVPEVHNVKCGRRVCAPDTDITSRHTPLRSVFVGAPYEQSIALFGGVGIVRGRVYCVVVGGAKRHCWGAPRRAAAGTLVNGQDPPAAGICGAPVPRSSAGAETGCRDLPGDRRRIDLSTCGDTL